MINEASYIKIHQWLKEKFGKPLFCENEKCPGRSKEFHWALLKDKQYEYKRQNFIRLCNPCHRQYDIKFKNTGKFIAKYDRLRCYPSDGLELRVMAKEKGGKTVPADILHDLLILYAT